MMAGSAWGACTSGTYNLNTGYTGRACYAGTTCATYGYYECSNICGERCGGTYQSGTAYYTGLSNVTIWNDSYGLNMCIAQPKGCISVDSYTNVNCTYTQRCDTQAEVDSVYCEQNPQAEGCEQEQDTTLYYCKQEYSTSSQGWMAYIFKCSCKQQGGTITGCNGKQNVDVVEDCTPYRGPLDGDCAQNGYNSGVNGDRDSTGQNAQCFAAIGANCIMKDRASGNTFDCPCDGSCDYAMRKMATGECVNPYPQPETPSDTLELPPSGGGTPPPWSSASSEPPPSFGNEQAALDGLYGVVDTIRDTLNRAVVPSLRNIQANTQQTNEYLQQIAAKDMNVNVSAPDVNVNVENNTDVSGIQSRQDRQYASDTAFQSRVLGALGALSDTAGAGNPNDTAGSGAALQGRLNQIDSAVGAYGVPDMRDSIPSAVEGIRTKTRNMRDSIAGGAIGDSVNAWSQAFLNNGVLTGNGSNTCPAALTRGVAFTFPHVGTIQAGSLGQYLCTPVAGLSVTLWQVARLLMRALVAIACMWWLFREVTGTATGGGSDED